MEYCDPCGRYFGSEDALDQHLRTSSNHGYCSRCNRVFNSQSSRRQHIETSSRHNICIRCPNGEDFRTKDELDRHAETAHYACNACDREFRGADGLWKHDESVHNMCRECKQYFQSPSNLKNHQKTHAEKTITCPGCNNLFGSESAMVLHLEAGGCGSGVDEEDISDLAFECYQASKYTTGDGSDYDFECPTCETPFAFISGLLQHVESDACEEELVNGPLGRFLRFLRTRV
ncbi:hypothetical protein B0I35DRAFT_442053 [Stachybotrys elegans]|uniref:C2H2-type domain-containing protein n=1 Tax=Stachybotrys elegans TaxID=80388 RepID=A0A8K0SKS9_9HYPO|nr:hypothetical protein B0I35DRAFT_442053 [Stachybotrys elegans]